MFFDIRYSITYSTNLFCLVIRNRDTEFFFEFHDKFYSVERVGTEVVGEACFVLYFSFVYAQLVYDDQAEKISTVGDAVAYIEANVK